MKNRIKAILILFLTPALIPLLKAESTPAGGEESIAAEATQAQRETDSPGDGTFKGTVQSVDKRNRSLHVREESGNIMPVVIRPDSKITRNGKRAGFSQVKRGDKVTVKNPR